MMSPLNDRASDRTAPSRWDLTVYSRSGLSNRLKVLLSGLALAQATGRRYAMRWLTHPMSSPFDRLFQNEWNVRADVPLDYRRMIDPSWQAFPDLTQAHNDWVIVHHYDWLIQPARYPHHAALEERCASLFRELAPAPALQERIDRFRTNFFRAKMIGVHLRRGDFLFYRQDVVNNMAPTMETVDHWLDQAPEAGILLCTDDGAKDPFASRQIPFEGVAAQFARRYGARVVVNTPRTLDRRQPEATEDALVDLWLLRSTDWFVGTEGSSFSEMAVFGRAVPYVLTAAPTQRYASQVRWLKRCGLFGVLARVSQYEFGCLVAYPLILSRYKESVKSHVRRIARRNMDGR
jgi:hypothetical protein